MQTSRQANGRAQTALWMAGMGRWRGAPLKKAGSAPAKRDLPPLQGRPPRSPEPFTLLAPAMSQAATGSKLRVSCPGLDN